MHFSIRVPDKIGEKIKEIAAEEERTPSYMIRKAIEQIIEDRHDYLLAVSVLKENNPTVPWEEVKKSLGLTNNTEVVRRPLAAKKSAAVRETRVCHRKKAK